jgi:Fe-S oxidoreductase
MNKKRAMKTAIPILKHRWHEFHGHKVKGGALTARTDTDYIVWACPGCKQDLRRGDGITLLGSHSDVNVEDRGPHVLGCRIDCPMCGVTDYFKLPFERVEQ